VLDKHIVIFLRLQQALETLQITGLIATDYHASNLADWAFS